MEIGPTVIAATLLGCFLGGIVKGVSGSGLPQVAVPLIALVTSVPIAVAVVQLPAMSINLAQARPQRGASSQVLRHWPIFLTLFGATILGVGMLRLAPPSLLFAFMGTVTILAATFLVAKPGFGLPEKLRLPLGIPVALAAGLSAGLSSLAGPFLVPYYVALRLPKEVFIPAISLSYLAIIVPTMIFFLYWELVDPRFFLFSLVAVIPSLLGMLAGNRLRQLVDERQFRSIVLVTLLTTAAGLLVKAFVA
ncbi:sulfite exporter TauE/SafE family protein [Afifella pfennigii]|uniref:sulfite exporter TauE/SafE family protein n=1 Tax=Afifella pfennigii TaxID=209897 RepID=UPI000554339E|nr:sulfite exporter TauE/SafE family protein [Afifella pfennigii]